ncbi:hypothetical protein N9L92_04745 [Saprospiraceae bacterium]|nr:hypothetical protein [Saprospiraceae bacterium]
MIKGQQIFTEHFTDFLDCYVVIGGLALDVHMGEQAIPFRVTKDFDIILLVEALRPEFFKSFWSFIEAGAYERKETSAGPKKYYRFIKPQTEDYPYQIELFSRKPDAIQEIEGHHFVPIPAAEEISSLSAILMDEDYYTLTQNNTKVIEGLRIATEPLLICLKVKAFINLSEKKAAGEKIDSKVIKKHKNDIFRLGVTITGEERMDVPESIIQDLEKFYEIIKEESPDIKQLLKTMGVNTSININEIMDVIKSIFTKD